MDVLSSEQTDHGGSIGTTWPPAYEDGRVKGFYTAVIEEPEELEDPAERLEAYADDQDAGRVTCRFIVDDELLPEQASGDGEDLLAGYDLEIEATTALDGRWEDHGLLYLGTTDEDRSPPEALSQHHAELLEPAYDQESVTEPSPDGAYRVEHPDDPSSPLLDELEQLYDQRYTEYPVDLNQDTIAGLFEGENQVAVARDDDDAVVGAYVAEVAELPIDGGPVGSIRMAELTEAATAREHEGNGIGTALGHRLLENLAGMEIDMVYGEARADLVGVNVSAARMGREYWGQLPEHCRIGGDTTDIDPDRLAELGLDDAAIETISERPYGTLNVWGITGDRLRSRHG